MAAIGQVVSFCVVYFIIDMVILRYYTIHSTVFDYIVYEQIVSIFFVTCVAKHISVSRHCLYEDHTPHFVSAQVILGFGLGPAFCPLSDSGKGALGGATPSAFRGGANRAVFVIIPSELETYL